MKIFVGAEMNLKTSGIDHLNLEVKNLAGSVEFYKSLFGFKVLKDQPEDDSKIIGNDKVKLCLYESSKFKGFEKNGFYHFGLHIENFDDIIKKCEEMNVKLFYGGPVQWEKSKSIYIVDPNGYEIELTEIFGGGL
jgi:lactoylglutathione lyase